MVIVVLLLLPVIVHYESSPLCVIAPEVALISACWGCFEVAIQPTIPTVNEEYDSVSCD